MKEAEAEALTSICCFALAWDGLHLEELGVSHQSLGRLSGAVLATFLRHVFGEGKHRNAQQENEHSVLRKGTTRRTDQH